MSWLLAQLATPTQDLWDLGYSHLVCGAGAPHMVRALEECMVAFPLLGKCVRTFTWPGHGVGPRALCSFESWLCHSLAV